MSAMSPEKKKTSGIRGQVVEDRERCNPGKEETSGIRGQVPGAWE